MDNRDVDEAIAVKLFGWHYENVGSGFLLPPSNHPAMVNSWVAEWDEKGRPNWLPKYSEDISSAYEVTKEMNAKGYWFGCQILSSFSEAWFYIEKPIKARALPFELPLAICNAALFMLEGEK